MTLPHDWAVEGAFSAAHSSGTGYLPGGIGWYRGRFTLPQSDAGKALRLTFGGVYKHCRVWLNGYYLGYNAYGYSEFSFDIAHAACFGERENVLCVRVEHTDVADSRWYTGSGITRPVTLTIQQPCRFAEYGIVFSTPSVTEQMAAIRIQSTLINGENKAVSGTLRHTLTDAQGREALALEQPFALDVGESATFCTDGVLEQPLLWMVDDPQLYTLRSGMLLEGKEYNVTSTRVGVRSFAFDADNGFSLNGVPMKLKGVCIHHDAGCLGAAVPAKVWRRRLLKLKEAGCNAVRLSHNPHDSALLALCDELGFMAISEAFDEWEGCKNKWSHGHNVYPPLYQGYAGDFPQWHERDLRTLVRRDRNHPCVILWSIGNEIDYPNDPYCHPQFAQMAGNNDANKPAQEQLYNPNKPNMERIVTLCGELSAIVRQEDDTRPVTAALAFPELSMRLGFGEPLDVVGYNYKEECYEGDHALYPDKPLLGSENGKHYAAWRAVAEHPYISGQFLWTGIDFLGEAQGWPVHGSQAGLLTTAGFEKAAFWYRQSLWADAPVMRLCTAPVDAPLYEDDYLPVWNGMPGERKRVLLFTNQPEAELLLNGKSQGTGRIDPEKGFIHWDVAFESGMLDAVAPDGQRVKLISAGAAAGLRLTVADALCADGEDVAQVLVQAVDGAGDPVYTDSSMLYVEVSGAATLLGIDNGCQFDNERYTLPCRRLYHGQMVVYVRAGEEAGEATVTVAGESFAAVRAVVPVLPC